jgi:transposase
MTVPGVGPLVAMTFKSAVNDPSRIIKSKAVGALFGLTPKKYQSGEKDVTGGITRASDKMVRTELYEAANVLLSRITRFSKLKRWGMDVAKRRGSKRAKVALARKIGVIMRQNFLPRVRHPVHSRVVNPASRSHDLPTRAESQAIILSSGSRRPL